MHLRAFYSFIAFALVLTSSAEPFRSFEQVVDALNDKSNIGRDFDLTGELIGYFKSLDKEWTLDLQQSTNRLTIFEQNPPHAPAIDPGDFNFLDKLRIRGYLYPYADRIHLAYRIVERIGTGDPHLLPLISAAQLNAEASPGRLVSVKGLVRDAMRDDSDPNFIHLTIRDSSDTMQVMVHEYAPTPFDPLRYIGAEVRAYGICSDNKGGLRQHLGRVLAVSGQSNIDILVPPHTFENAQDLECLVHALPQQIMASGCRRCSGQVLAIWQGDTVLLKTAQNRIVRVHLQSGPLPRFGDEISVLGLPCTDFYNLNLLHATWRLIAQSSRPPEAPIKTTPSNLLTNERGQPQLMFRNYGKAIRMSGIVRYLPDHLHPTARMQIEVDGHLVSVDATANSSFLSGLGIGCKLSVTGTCVMEADNWNLNSAEKRNRGFFIVPRTADDIIVLSRPPWWTPARLMIVIGSLLAALLGILVWNRSLQILAHKRGKALANEELERLESDLKVCERTRLAVELHDSIAQNLTGVSMEIDTALRSDEPLPPNAAQHMGRALRTIDSCRGELRNCLWDLRSQALEEEDMNKAIRLTLSQTIGKADLSVRFNVLRSRFTDNTAHTILRIIRELAANAVRHGKATEIKVAGSIEDDVLKFSVRDNGYGFDPDSCPGVLDGHFGLQGVRERVASFEGDVQIESAPGKGTKVVVSINAPQTEDEAKI